MDILPFSHREGAINSSVLYKWYNPIPFLFSMQKNTSNTWKSFYRDNVNAHFSHPKQAPVPKRRSASAVYSHTYRYHTSYIYASHVKAIHAEN